MERTLLGLIALAFAYLLDLAFGDPPWLPHPVRLIGWAISKLEKTAFRFIKKSAGLKAAGFLIVAVIAGGAAVLVFLIINIAYRFHQAAGLFFELYVYYTILAGGDLRNHLRGVENALQSGKIEVARQKVALLVSRDTTDLEAGGLSRAALESLFENSSDGLVAPLFFAAVGGPASAVFYKAVSTLDSMIGYNNEKYRNLGFAAAKLDDLLNLIPARLTAVLILLAGIGRSSFGKAWQVLIADRYKHESPNSAWPEAAAAGVLGVRLGGKVFYGGRLKERPVINKSGRETVPGDIGAGLELFNRSSLLAFIACLILTWGLVVTEGLKF
jgi:adenosylcobinamide-phosphate synthase